MITVRFLTSLSQFALFPHCFFLSVSIIILGFSHAGFALPVQCFSLVQFGQDFMSEMCVVITGTLGNTLNEIFSFFNLYLVPT